MSRAIREHEPNLAITEMHGRSEPTSTALRKSLLQDRIFGWDVEKANQEAYKAHKRQIKYNLALMFADAAINASHKDYELRRPAQLLKLTQNRNYVIDVHDLPLDNRADFVAIGINSDIQRTLGISALLGIYDVIVYRDADHLASNVPYAVTVELGRGENNELISQNVARLRACMGSVAIGDIPSVNSDDFDFYERITEIQVEQAKELGLSKLPVVEPFGVLSDEIICRLRRNGIELSVGNYVADYWNGQSSSPDKWFGSVLKRIQNPFSVLTVNESHILQSALLQR